MMKTNKGFSLMELTIVLAILAIIAVIIIPRFMNTTDRARLRGDVQSVRVIQNAMDLYQAERGSTTWDDMDITLTRLANAGLLSYPVAEPQTGGEWTLLPDMNNIPNRRAAVNITGNDVSSTIREIAATLPDAERQFIVY